MNNTNKTKIATLHRLRKKMLHEKNTKRSLNNNNNIRNANNLIIHETPKSNVNAIMESHIINNSNIPQVYIKSLKGHRPTNQDKHLAFKNDKLELWCVCDGHGETDKVSEYIINIIPKLFTNKKIKYPLSKSQITKIYNNIQKTICEQPYGETSGSTCLLVIKYDNTIYTINVGDSRAILYNGSKTMQLSRDHKPLEPSEKERILKSGGKIMFDGTSYRVNGLSLSRAFGDCDSQLTSPIPDITLKKLTHSDKFLVLGCDGLYDTVDNNTITNIILNTCFDSNFNRININVNIADKLAKYAINNGSDDNVSVIVVFL